MPEASWLDSTIACSVSVHAWGNSKGVKAADVSQYSGELAEKAAKKRLAVTKRLLDCKEYQAIQSRDGFAGQWFKAHSVPSLFRNGVYAVPMSHIDAWTGYLAEYTAERQHTLVPEFLGAYSEARQRAQYDDELGVLYRAEDYPDVQDMGRKFYVEVRYVELGVPGKLALIAPEAFAQAQAELAATVEQGKAHIEAILCHEAVTMVQGLRGALQGLDDGTLKKFYDSHIQKIVEWSDLFLEARNVTGFEELASVAEQIRAVAMGCEKDSLKKFSFIRQEVKKELDGALTTLKGLMQARPVRQIELD